MVVGFGIQDPLWAAKASNFFTYFSIASLWTFFPKFCKNLDFSESQLGIIMAFPCIMCIVGGPLWGFIADYSGKAKLVHLFCIGSGTLILFFSRYVTSFYLMCAFVMISHLQLHPAWSLLDKAVMSLIDNLGFGEYGQQRLFGSLGVSVGAILVGFLVHYYGIGWAFNIHLGSGILCLITLIYLFKGGKSEETKDQSTLRPSKISNVHEPSFREGLQQLKTISELPWLFLVLWILGAMVGAVGSFLPLYIEEVPHGTSVLVGFATSIQTVSEVPAFFYANRIVKKLGITKVMLISLLFFALRFILYALINNAYLILPVELIHGITFSLAWAACTEYSFEAAPKNTEGTMLGFLAATVNGLGKGSGSLIAGVMWQNLGSSYMWYLLTLAVPFAIFFLFIFHKIKTKRELSTGSNELDLTLLTREERDSVIRSAALRFSVSSITDAHVVTNPHKNSQDEYMTV